MGNALRNGWISITEFSTLYGKDKSNVHKAANELPLCYIDNQPKIKFVFEPMLCMKMNIEPREDIGVECFIIPYDVQIGYTNTTREEEKFAVVTVNYMRILKDPYVYDDVKFALKHSAIDKFRVMYGHWETVTPLVLGINENIVEEDFNID